MNQIPRRVKNSLTGLRVVFILVGIVVAVGVTATYLAGHVVIRSRDRVQQYDEILAELQDVLVTVEDAETGQRGYLITGQQEYLAPYREAVDRIHRRLEGLRKLAEEGRLPKDAVQKLGGMIQQKFSELDETVQIYERGGAKSAWDHVRSGTGRRLMDSIRTSLFDLEAALQSTRADAHRADESATAYRTVTFVLCGILILVFLLWAYLRLRKEVLEQYVAALEMQRQREILSVTLSSIGDAVIITDTTAKITFLNPVAEQLTGWTNAEAFEQPCAKIFHILNESSRSAVESPVEKVLRNGTIIGLANHTLLVRKDGTELPIDDSGAPIREPDGTIRGVVLVFRDFSEHKIAERALIEAKEAVEAASQAKDKFLAALSHELRTPLTPVLATLSTWDAKKILPIELRSDLQLVRRNVELEARLIDDLLDITRIESGKLSLEKQIVDLHDIIHATLSLFGADCETRQIKLSTRLEASRPFTEGDPARLQQIFWNIIGNAVKFTPAGGTIEITTNNPTEDRIDLTVTDTGIGMTEATQQRLFQRFEQGDLPPTARQRGLGLGLSIAKALTESHGGTLGATTKGLNRGSSFMVNLPARPAPLSREGTGPLPAASPGKSLDILLLEDHVDTSVVLASLLHHLGHKVTTASSITEALGRAHEYDFELVLSDIGLPDGSGIDFIREFRKTSQTPAIALTGYGMAEDVELCLSAGFNRHLTKPVDFEKLEVALREIAAM